MLPERMQEFIIMLLIENRALMGSGEFYSYLDEKYDLEAFNKRYKERLDEFLNDYALNKTEKSD